MDRRRRPPSGRNTGSGSDGNYRLDLAYPEQKIGIEYDG
jgi:hypothetical protein